MKKLSAAKLILASLFLMHTGRSMAQITPLPVDGVHHEFQEYFSNATFTNVSDAVFVYFTSGQFTWGYERGGGFRVMGVDQVNRTEHFVANAYFASTEGWAVANIKRELEFQIAGRDPSRSYFIDAFQTLRVKNSDKRPLVGPNPSSYNTLYLVCISTGAELPAGRAITRTSGNYGVWSDINLGVNVTVSPSVCPDNRFKIAYGTFGAQDLILSPLRLRTLNIN